jgi:hypothetical protein
MEPEVLLSCLKEPSTNPKSEPDESNLYQTILCLFKIL